MEGYAREVVKKPAIHSMTCTVFILFSIHSVTKVQFRTYLIIEKVNVQNLRTYLMIEKVTVQNLRTYLIFEKVHSCA